jgi:hypothetical protein
MAFHVRAALEGRFRSDTGVPWQKKDNTSQALIGLPFHFFFSDNFELFFEPVLAADPWYYNHPVSKWGSNVPWADRIDLNMPLRAFAALGGAWWTFQIGRDRLSFGPGRTGNMAVSDTPDYYDFARISFFSDVFKYSVLVSQMPLNAEHLVADASSLALPPPAMGYDLLETTNRYLYFHRLDIRLFKKFSIGISEGVMAGNSPLELRFLNPVTVFHSFFSWLDYPEWGAAGGDMNGSLFSLDLEWAFLPGWALYSQIVMNEFSTPYESSRYPDQPPPGMGYLLGAEYAVPLGSWALSFYAELVYADPFLYTLSTPFASMIWMRRLSDIGAKELRYAFFGHAEGRDMFLAALGASARGKKISLGLDLSLKMQGEHGLKWDWSPRYNTQNSPSGNPETRGIVILSLALKVLPNCTIDCRIGETVLLNAGHIPGERKYGTEAGFGVRFYY